VLAGVTERDGCFVPRNEVTNLATHTIVTAVLFGVIVLESLGIMGDEVER
jgi:hypothetical protein